MKNKYKRCSWRQENGRENLGFGQTGEVKEINCHSNSFGWPLAFRPDGDKRWYPCSLLEIFFYGS